MPFIELSATSNFTFLTGASHPEELMRRAANLGLPALAIADENSVAGIVRAWCEAKEITREQGSAPRLIPAARIVTREGFSVTVLPRDRAAWARLCRLLTLGKRAAKKGNCDLGFSDLLDHAEGQEMLLHPPARLTTAAHVLTGEGAACLSSHWRDRAEPSLPPSGMPEPPPCPDVNRQDATEPRPSPRANTQGRDIPEPPPAPRPVAQRYGTTRPHELTPEWRGMAERLAAHCSGRVALILAPTYAGQDAVRFARLAELARGLGIPTVASGLPILHHGSRRRLADVLSAIRLGCRVDQLGRRALPNGEQRLRSEAEMLRLYRGHEDAIHRSAEIAARLGFCLSQLRYEYPAEIADGESATDRLARLAAEGLEWRYPKGVPAKVRAQADHELALIAKLGYEPYFLTVHDIVQFARGRGILCQGRGSAANSIVCYALGVTSVSPEIGTMVFERFVSEARNEPPDIDVDFEHERREEVIQHIYERYGRHRAGLCATVIHYRGKRAVREVGRAMGLSEDTLAAMSSQIWGWGGPGSLTEQRLREIGLDPADRRLWLTLQLIDEIQGFPRHLSQHVGGFVITEGRLDELVPIENAAMEDRTVISWDKDDIDALGILKVDVLALGMLTCIRKAFELIETHHGIRHTLATLPDQDARTYDMLCRADSLGVFQVESRAQMNFLPRMRPRCFYDLVIQVAIIRPGPIQGDMVHPYIRRRNREEEVSFPSDELGRVLSKTLGVPLFQEQAMQIAIIGAGFTPDEADRLRRALATFKKHGNVTALKDRFMEGMRANGYDEDFATRCFSQIEGFGSYGFPESHAASFAFLVYASAWIKCHHPGIFACALLNSQPMGFYAPAQIVRDARAHGVVVLPPCINASRWDNIMEPDGGGRLALRLGFRQIKGVAEEEALWIAAARGNGYRAVEDVWRRAGIAPATVTRLAEADCFATLGLTRREAMWQARALSGDKPLPLFAGDLDGERIVEPPVVLAEMTLGQQVVEDYVAFHLTLRAHPMAILRMGCDGTS